MLCSLLAPLPPLRRDLHRLAPRLSPPINGHRALAATFPSSRGRTSLRRCSFPLPVLPRLMAPPLPARGVRGSNRGGKAVAPEVGGSPEGSGRGAPMSAEPRAGCGGCAGLGSRCGRRLLFPAPEAAGPVGRALGCWQSAMGSGGLCVRGSALGKQKRRCKQRYALACSLNTSCCSFRRATPGVVLA